MPCPLDPTVQLRGIVPAECSVFKSALSPLRLAFRTSDGAAAPVEMPLLPHKSDSATPLQLKPLQACS